MEYCSFKGFLEVLLIQGLFTSIQSSIEFTHHYGQISPQKPELPHAEVLPVVVSPPSLKEVQQAVQESSEQVEVHEAEEVLVKLLERVVEVALSQVDGGSDAKVDPDTDQKASKEEVSPKAEVLEQASEDEKMGLSEEDTGVEEKQEEEEVDAFEGVLEHRGVVMEEDDTAAGLVEKPTPGLKVREAEREKVTDETLGTDFSVEVVARDVATLEEIGRGLAVEEDVEGNNKDQVVLLEENGATESEIQEAMETPTVVNVAVARQPEQQTMVESEPSHGVADVAHIGADGVKEKSLEEEAQVEKIEGETIVLPSDKYDIEATQTGFGEPVVEEEEVNITRKHDGPEEEKEGHIVKVGAAVEIDLKSTNMRKAKVDDNDEESVIKEEPVALVNKKGDKKEEEEQGRLEISAGSAKEDQVISGPEPDDDAETSIKQSPENQASTAKLFLIDVVTEEKIQSDANDIITPTNDVFPDDPADAQPTLVNFMNDVLAEHSQTEGNAPREADELIKDPVGTTESSKLGLETWKIGAVTAAVFLVLETIVIIIYIVKCRNKNSEMASQRSCEEGCVEPEAATGDDYSDDTLPAGNGDTQQIAALDPSDVASTLAKEKEQRGDEHGIAVSNLPPSSTDERANTGLRLNSSQDLRTSIL